MSSSSKWILRNGHVTAALISCTYYTQQKKLSICIVFGHHLLALIFGPTPLDNLQQNLMICLVRKEKIFCTICVMLDIHYILWITFICKVDQKLQYSLLEKKEDIVYIYQFFRSFILHLHTQELHFFLWFILFHYCLGKISTPPKFFSYFQYQFFGQILSLISNMIFYDL